MAAGSNLYQSQQQLMALAVAITRKGDAAKSCLIQRYRHSGSFFTGSISPLLYCIARELLYVCIIELPRRDMTTQCAG